MDANDNTVIEGSVESVRGPVRTISIDEVMSNRRALEAAGKIPTPDPVYNSDLVARTWLDDMPSDYDYLKQTLQSPAPVEAGSQTFETFAPVEAFGAVGAIEAIGESSQRKRNSVVAGVGSTFRVAKWTITTTFTWLLRTIYWIIPSTIAFVLNGFAAALVLYFLRPQGFLAYTVSIVLLFFAGIIPGAITGVGQTAALRSVHNNLGSSIWFMVTLGGNCLGLPIATCVGWYVTMQVGGYNGQALGLLIGLLLFGLLIGGFQAYILKYSEVRLWWLWLVPSALGMVAFVAGVMVVTSVDRQTDFFGGAMWGGIIYGAITGISLVFLLRESVQFNRSLEG